MLKKFLFLTLIGFCLSFTSLAQKTVVTDNKAKAMLLGKHKISLQWISWDYFGTATVTNKRGVFYLKGKQNQQNGQNFVQIEGKITKINSKDFTFVGKIITQIDHINSGNPCTRNGEMTFRITGKRKYWRLMQIDNPCDGVADYVDIYFR